MDIKHFFTVPYTYFLAAGFGGLVGVWWARMTPNTGNVTLVLSIAALTVGVFLHPWTSIQPLFIRFVWALATCSVLTLAVYYTLWVSPSFLIPAAYPTPPNACDNCPPGLISPSMKLALIGPMATAYGPRQKPFALIRIGDQDVLGIENAPTGIVLNATLRDDSGQLIAAITKNIYKPYAANDYEVTSNQHAVLILNSKDQIVLSVQYLNPQTMKVLGIFNVPNKPTVIIEEGAITMGGQLVQFPAGMCSINNAPEGSWAQLKAAIVIA